jgi:hypothetical protein
MKLHLKSLLCAGLALVVGTEVQAGWNSVAHVMCGDGPIRRALRGGSDCPEPAPARTSQKPTVEYETVTRYEPYTVMKPEYVQEPVDVKVTSFYWDPVQTYVRRSFYDPCTGQCQQVDEPRTSYVRKREVRTETRYLEKVRMVPVEMQREVTETRPKYTYYGPVTKKYGPSVEVGPRVNEIRGESGAEPYTPIRGQNFPTVPSEMKRIEGVRAPIRSEQPRSTSDYRFNALSTSQSKPLGSRVIGEVLKSDRETPVSEAKVVFVSATDSNERHYFTTDTFGGFSAELPAGEWYVPHRPSRDLPAAGQQRTAEPDRDGCRDAVLGAVDI